ncbi:LamG domain-containing protein [Streptacidiphilus cavernicola]|uniref:LamG domain-containing protein n=1 Tax=Streptacidiphilus cavernicola TaxID=3342716 RepID=A0ABV6W4F1_9ACTN
MTADTAGGFSTVIVVKSAAAASNPVLKSLVFGTATSGLTLANDAQGALSAVDGTGATVFSAATPMMWDSSTDPATPAPQVQASPAGRTTSQLVAATTADTDGAVDGDPATSSPQGPGANAQTAAMPATVSGSAISLTPDQSILTGADTQYPVYLDPSWIPDDRTLQSFTWTQSASPSSASNYHTGSSTSLYPAVGTCGNDYAGGCSPSDTERTYYQFNTTAWNGAIIHTAWLNVKQHASANWSCTTTYPVSLYTTPPISSSTTWNSMKDATVTKVGTIDMAGAGGDCGTDVAYGYNIAGTVKSLLNGTTAHNTLTFGLMSGAESNDLGFKRFTANPTLTITYDRTPTPPTGLKTSKAQAGSYASGALAANDTCTATANSAYSTWGWINAAGTTLNAAPSGPSQAQYAAAYRLWDDSVSSTSDVYDFTTGYVNKGTNAPSQAQTVQYVDPTTGAVVNNGANLIDGHLYGWDAASSDGLVPNSAGSSVCHFRVDATAPTFTFGTSTDFPPSGSGTTPTKHLGDTGTIPFTDGDATPVNYTGTAQPAQVSGVACMRYGNDPTLTSDAWKCGSQLPTGSISTTPAHWGTNIVFAQVMDAAGNQSQIQPYSFYVPWTAGKLAYGDVTGDGVPDVLAANPTTGNLLDYQQARNFTPATATNDPAATAAQAPPSDPNADTTTNGWNGFHITHRGSVTGTANVDDLFVHQDASPTDTSTTKLGGSQLYWYPNNTQDPGFFTAGGTALHRPDCDPAAGSCAGFTDGDTWANTSQITPIGSMGDIPNPDGGDTNGLLAVEGDNLWYYALADGAGTSTGDGSNATRFAPPTLVASGGWSHYDLMVPGDATATGKPAIWARVRTAVGGHAAGDIIQFPITVDTAATYQPQIVAPNSIPSPQPGAGVSCNTGSDGYPVCTYTRITGVGTPTTIGTGFATAAYPLIGADSDLSGTSATPGTGTPDLWASTGSGAITVFNGTTTDGTATTAVTGLTHPDDQWLLATGGTDANGQHPATNLGSVTFSATDVPAGPNALTAAGGSANLTGSTSTFLKASAPAVNTQSSYTVSAWVKTSSATATGSAIGQGTTAHQAFYLGYDSTQKAWFYQTTTTNDANAAFPTAESPANSATPGTWAHLVATYSAPTHNPDGSTVAGFMTLYVNGTLVATAANATPQYDSTLPLTIGGCVHTATSTTDYSSFTGSIADVRTFPYTLTAIQAAQLK